GAKRVFSLRAGGICGFSTKDTARSAFGWKRGRWDRERDCGKRLGCATGNGGCAVASFVCAVRDASGARQPGDPGFSFDGDAGGGRAASAAGISADAPCRQRPGAAAGKVRIFHRESATLAGTDGAIGKTDFAGSTGGGSGT